MTVKDRNKGLGGSRDPATVSEFFDREEEINTLWRERREGAEGKRIFLCILCPKLI